MQLADWRRRFAVDLCPPPKDKLKKRVYEYRYKINDSQGVNKSQNDPVMEAIIALMRLLTIEDMGFAAARIRVWPLTNSPQIWPPTTRGLDVKFYGFKASYEEFPIAVPITVSNGEGRLLTRLLVRDEGVWKPLSDWLKQLPVHERLFRDCKRRLLAQRTWWSKNGKVFRLMDLPTEIRMILFAHILGSKPHPLVIPDEDKVCLSDCWGCCGKDSIRQLRLPTGFLERRCPEDFNPFGRSTPNYEILNLGGQIGQLIREEALKAAWEETYKHFLNEHDFVGVMTATPPSGYNWLTRIELNLHLDGYLPFFNIGVDPAIHILPIRAKPCGGHYLKQISTLRELRLRFPSPLDIEWFNPWHTAWMDRTQGERPGESKWAKDLLLTWAPCSKTAADWVLTFALPYIKHIPEVYLAGMIKTSVKAKWGYILAKEYQYRNVEGGYPGYDWDEAMSRILGQPATLVPPCHCPYPCNQVPLTRYQPEDFGAPHHFDLDDVFDQDVHERLKRYVAVYQKYPILFGRYAQDLSEYTEEWYEKNKSA
jgi:hypothetical protein